MQRLGLWIARPGEVARRYMAFISFGLVAVVPICVCLSGIAVEAIDSTNTTISMPLSARRVVFISQNNTRKSILHSRMMGQVPVWQKMHLQVHSRGCNFASLLGSQASMFSCFGSYWHWCSKTRSLGEDDVAFADDSKDKLGLYLDGI